MTAGGTAQTPWSAIARDARLSPSGRSMELLIVEDNPGDVRLTEEAFKLSGPKPRVTVVHDGVEALRFLRREAPYSDASKPDLVLLDLNLPKMSGREVLQQIKSDPELRRIPVIVWTTSRSERDVAAVYEMHANCCVTKPVDLDSFFRLIHAAQHFWFEVATLPSR